MCKGAQAGAQKSFDRLSCQKENIQVTVSFSFFSCLFASLSQKHLEGTQEAINPDGMLTTFVITDLQ